LTVIHYCCYWPDIDGVDVCGFILEVEDLHPSISGRSRVHEDRDMRQATRDLPTEPFDPKRDHPEAAFYADAVALPVVCAGPGFTFSELRAASTVYRRARGLGCFFNPHPTVPETPLCGRPAGLNGLCEEHDTPAERPARGPTLSELTDRTDESG
jgi:hypothetical protein